MSRTVSQITRQLVEKRHVRLIVAIFQKTQERVDEPNVYRKKYCTWQIGYLILEKNAIRSRLRVRPEPFNWQPMKYEPETYPQDHGRHPMQNPDE